MLLFPVTVICVSLPAAVLTSKHILESPTSKLGDETGRHIYSKYSSDTWSLHTLVLYAIIPVTVIMRLCLQ